jgi:hypothetical protein
MRLGFISQKPLIIAIMAPECFSALSDVQRIFPRSRKVKIEMLLMGGTHRE